MCNASLPSLFYLIGLNRAQNYYIYLYLQRKNIFFFLVLNVFIHIAFCGCAIV